MNRLKRLIFCYVVLIAKGAFVFCGVNVSKEQSLPSRQNLAAAALVQCTGFKEVGASSTPSQTLKPDAAVVYIVDQKKIDK